MKKLLLFIVAALTAITATAADILLIDGRVLKNAEIISQSPSAVMIRHDTGLCSAQKKLLPADLLAKYPIDEAGERIAEQKAEEGRRAASEWAKSEAQRIERLRADRAESAAANALRDAAIQVAEDTAYASARREITSRAKDWFRLEYKAANGSRLTMGSTIVLDTLEPVTGWPGCWRATGRARVEQYQSQGSTFTTEDLRIECELTQAGRASSFVLRLK